jgi:hypothetical protein
MKTIIENGFEFKVSDNYPTPPYTKMRSNIYNSPKQPTKLDNIKTEAAKIDFESMDIAKVGNLLKLLLQEKGIL